MELHRQLLLADRPHLHDLVVPHLPLQSHAGVVPTVRHGGDHRPDAGPAGGQAAEGGTQGQAPGGVRPRHRHRRAGVVGGAPVRRWAI